MLSKLFVGAVATLAAATLPVLADEAWVLRINQLSHVGEHCPYVRMDSGDLGSMVPSFAFRPTVGSASATIVMNVYPMYDRTTFYRLVEDRHHAPDGCSELAFSVDMKTGDIGSGFFIHCGAGEIDRASGFGYDPDSNKKFGEKNHDAWVQRAAAIIDEAEEIKKLCKV